MSFQDGIQRVMKIVCTAILATVVLFIAYAPGEAYKQETRGYFRGVENGRMTIELPNSRGKEYFWVNTGTAVVNVGRPMKLLRIPKNAVVKVTYEAGTATEVLVEEVPK